MFPLQDYHEKELENMDPHRYLRLPDHPSALQMKEIVWRLATKQLKPTDWKKLAVHWKFTSEHIHSIEHQYTGISLFVTLLHSHHTPHHTPRPIPLLP